MNRKTVGLMLAATLSSNLFAAYNVRMPEIRPQYRGAVAGEWTLDHEAALSAAKAEGKCTLLFNTGSWWCPFCETLEELVLTSRAWKDYVAENGFYLSMLDFPYRGHVSDEEIGKSTHPELGDGWGFTCWLMNAEYLRDNGLTEQEGLAAIMAEYERQKRLGENTIGKETTIVNCLTGEDFTYRKVGYPTLIVYDADGSEFGRVSFPWYSTSQVSAREAQDYFIQAIDNLIKGWCSICEDPLSGTPPTDAAQKYNGWVKGEDGICGLVEFKLGKRSAKGLSNVSGALTIGGKKTSLKAVKVSDLNQHVTFAVKVDGQDRRLWVKFGQFGLSGEITELAEACCDMPGAGRVLYMITGGRNLFSAKDVVAKTAVASCPVGAWSVVLKPTDATAPSAFARGYGTLSVELKAKGKAKVSGTMGDGTRVNVSSTAIVGDNGMSCLPVLASLNGKKGGFGFVLWFRNGNPLCFEDVSKWVCTDRQHPFTATCMPMVAQIGVPDEDLEFELSGFDGTIGGQTVIGDPTADAIEVDGLRWRGTGETSFKAMCAKKTGILKGKMTFRVAKASGGAKNVTGTFAGIVLAGSGYGTVTVKDVGSWPVKIGACGGCSD